MKKIKKVSELKNKIKKGTISLLTNYGEKSLISTKDLKKIDVKEILVNDNNISKKLKNNESTLISELDIKLINSLKKTYTSSPRPKLDLSDINLKNKK